jgi:hypothetical protein
MKKFIPREKLSKKARKEQDARDRGTWYGLNPATRTLESKKRYDRKKARKMYDDPFSGLFIKIGGFTWK